jgi:hypothetical protein
MTAPRNYFEARIRAIVKDQLAEADFVSSRHCHTATGLDKKTDFVVPRIRRKGSLAFFLLGRLEGRRCFLATP